MLYFRPCFPDPIKSGLENHRYLYFRTCRRDNGGHDIFFLIGRILLHKNSTKKNMKMYVQYLRPAILKHHVF